MAWTFNLDELCGDLAERTKDRGRRQPRIPPQLDDLDVARRRQFITMRLDSGQYPIGISYSDNDIAALPLVRHDFHGHWNCTLLPGETP